MTENEQIERLRQAIEDEANRQPKTWDWYDLARAAHAALRTQPQPQQDVAALCEWLGAIAGFIRDGWPPASEETPENISARLLQAADALTALATRKAELEWAIIQERKDHGERYAEAMIECNRLDARNAELEQQLAAAEPHIRAKVEAEVVAWLRTEEANRIAFATDGSDALADAITRGAHRND
jgi:hypothetical protein